MPNTKFKSVFEHKFTGKLPPEGTVFASVICDLSETTLHFVSVASVEEWKEYRRLEQERVSSKLR